MQDYSEFPPFHSFKKVLQFSPSVALVYAAIWKSKSDKFDLKCKRREIAKRFSISPTVFKNNLLMLSRLELLTFQESKDIFLIDFAQQSN